MVLKKITSLSFLFLFVFCNTEIGQLFKIPNLIQHYSVHKNHDDKQVLSFINFAVSHYNNRQLHEDVDELDQHEKLPFKTQTTHFDSVVLAYTESQSFFSDTKKLLFSVNQPLPVYNEGYISTIFIAIWHPPKLV